MRVMVFCIGDEDMMESGAVGLGKLNLITTVIAPGVSSIPNQLFVYAASSEGDFHCMALENKV